MLCCTSKALLETLLPRAYSECAGIAVLCKVACVVGECHYMAVPLDRTWPRLEARLMGAVGITSIGRNGSDNGLSVLIYISSTAAPHEGFQTR